MNWGIAVLQTAKSLLDHVISISYKGGVAKILLDSAIPPQPKKRAENQCLEGDMMIPAEMAFPRFAKS